MDHKDKLKFIQDMAKMGLEHVQHYDIGGTVNNAVNPNTGVAGTIGGILGLNDNFQAGSADINAGTTQGQLNQAYVGSQAGLDRLNENNASLQPGVAAGAQQQSQLAQQFAAQANGTGPSVAVNQLNQATQANTANQAALMAGQRGAGANPALIARQAAMQGAANQQQAAGQAATLRAQEQISGQQNLANLSSNQINQGTGAVSAVNQAQQGEQNILQNANTSANNAAVNMQSNINNTNAQTAAANQSMAGGILGGVTKGLSGLFAEGGDVKSPAAETTVRPDGGFGKVIQIMAEGGPASVEKENYSPWDSMKQGASDLVNHPIDTMKEVAKGATMSRYPEKLAEGGTACNPVKMGYMQRFAVGGSSGGSPITGNPLVQGGGITQGPASAVGQYLNTPSASIGLNGPGSMGAVPQGTNFAQAIQDGLDSRKKPAISGSPGALPNEDRSTFNGPSLAGGASDAIGDTQPDVAAPFGGSSYSIDGSPGVEFSAQGGKITAKQQGEMLKNKSLMKKGGAVKAKTAAQKATVKGDSYSNDKVPAMLSEGEFVLDRDTMEDKGPIGQMARTLAAHINAQKNNKAKR